MPITIALLASWMIVSKHRANVEQLTRVFWIHLLDVCSMFTRSCKRSITNPVTLAAGKSNPNAMCYLL